MTTALKEIATLAETLALYFHAEMHVGGFDACPRCEPDRDLISRARAEMERGVDVLLLAQHMEDARWGVDLGWVEDMTKALRAQGVRVLDGKESSDV